ncbi:transcription factor jun-D-like [Panicum virgatum]|uniref:transcription factor jun-D-like n=1 Tax=Panicum virgatum TaxID=38727 RepID=UPI0019D536E1|nr:transcription factor jun-D-like [Panicum virgatum]
MARARAGACPCLPELPWRRLGGEDVERSGAGCGVAGQGGAAAAEAQRGGRAAAGLGSAPAMATVVLISLPATAVLHSLPATAARGRPPSLTSALPACASSLPPHGQAEALTVAAAAWVGRGGGDVAEQGEGRRPPAQQAAAGGASGGGTGEGKELASGGRARRGQGLPRVPPTGGLLRAVDDGGGEEDTGHLCLLRKREDT